MQAMQDFEPVPGRPEEVAPDIRRILAPNPSALTGPGTNTYLVGRTALAVIDPGPERPDHLDAILEAIGPGQHVSHILVTHAHLDHSPLSRELAARTGAPVHAFGDALAGRSEVMAKLAAQADLGGGEGRDSAFRPDVALPHDSVVDGPDWQLRALWTPGHFGNHLCFAWNDIVFTGDLVLGFASSLVSPPDGDLTDFMASCRALRNRPARLFLPGHGPSIEAPHARLDWLLSHREGRERAILDALAQAPGTADALAARVYDDIDPALLPAASRNVLAHLIDLAGKSRVVPEGQLAADGIFRLA